MKISNLTCRTQRRSDWRLLIGSGLWTDFVLDLCRTQEIDRAPVPSLAVRSSSANIEHQIEGRVDNVVSGEIAIKMLEGSGAKHLSVQSGLFCSKYFGTETHRFTGKHPYGLVGTHLADCFRLPENASVTCSCSRCG